MKAWLTVLCKRLVRQRAFWAVMLLTPLWALARARAAAAPAGGISIGLAAPSDPTARAAVDSLADAGRLIRFTVYADEAALRQDVLRGTLRAGYVFADDLTDAITAAPPRPVATRISGSGGMLSALVDEVVFAGLFAAVGERIATDYIAAAPVIPDAAAAKQSVALGYRSDLISVTRVYTKESVQGGAVTQAAAVTFPVRGFAAVLLLIAALLGAYTAIADGEGGLHLRLSPRMRFGVRALCCALPPLSLTPMLLLSVRAGGVWTALWAELGAAAAYALLCASIALVLATALPHRSAPTACVPVAVLSAFALCPIFVDVTAYYPALRPVARLLPTHWYLSAIQSRGGIAVMLAATLLLFCAAAALSLLTKKQTGRRR